MNKGRDQRIKEIFWYLLKFGLSFCLLYFGSQVVIGLSTPGNYYSPFVEHYLDFITPLRASFLYGSKSFLSLLGYHSFVTSNYILAMQTASIRMVYSCLGIGIMSFWTAFVFANKGSIRRKAIWILSGLAALWCINILRVSLLLVALQNHWQIPFGWDHHTWFNIVAYGFIFLMIYLYDRSGRQKAKGVEISALSTERNRAVISEVVDKNQTVN